MIWHAYMLAKAPPREGATKKDPIEHVNVFLEELEADSKTEAQLIAAARYGTKAFVTSALSDLTP